MKRRNLKSTGGPRTAEQRAGIVLAILREDLSLEEAARLYDVPQETIVEWREEFLLRLERSKRTGSEATGVGSPDDDEEPRGDLPGAARVVGGNGVQAEPQQLALESLESQRIQLEHERDTLMARNVELAQELQVLRQSTGVRLVVFYWRVLEHLAPLGSRRRHLVQSFQALVRGLVKGPPAQSTEMGRCPGPESCVLLTAAGAREELRLDFSLFAARVQTSEAPTSIVVLAGTPLSESEGQRPTQLALELANRGIPVLYVYWRWSANTWFPQDRIDDGILQMPIDVFLEDFEATLHAVETRSPIAMIEFPHPSFFSVIAELNGRGWITVYDVLDDWAEFHRVGQAAWYSEAFERHLLQTVDAVFTVNGHLAATIAKRGHNEVSVNSNGLRTGIEHFDQAASLDRGEVTVGYFGYLSDAWFDWNLVVKAAGLRPGWRFYLIGYGEDARHLDDLPPNVIFLGKMPQKELARYAANWDVAIVPFKDSELAAGADPIKIYEYLAMGLPVVVTGVFGPPGADPWVHRASTVDEFMSQLEKAAAATAADRNDGRRFAGGCTWSARLDDLLSRLDAGEQRVGVKHQLFRGLP